MAIYELPKSLHPNFRFPDKKPIVGAAPDPSKGASLVVFDRDSRNSVTNLKASSVPATSFTRYGAVATTTSGGVEAIEFANTAATQFDGAWTFAAVFDAKSSEGLFPGLMSRRSSFSDGFVECYFDNRSGGGPLEIAVFNGSNTTINFNAITLTNIIAEGPVFLGISADSTGIEVVYRPLDKSASHYSLTTNMSAKNTGSHGFSVGGLETGSSNDHTFADFYIVSTYKRRLSKAELLELSYAPYSHLKPKTPAFYFTTDAGGGEFTLSASSGSYTYSGTDASLTAYFTLSANTGSYTYTGTNADLLSGVTLQADSGSYGYSGTSVNLTLARLLDASSGTYTYSGTSVNLTYTPSGSFTLTGESGSYSYTGTASGLISDRSLAADSGSYTYTGSTVTLATGYGLQAESGTYTYTGLSIDFSSNKVLSADNGVYVYNGNNAALTFTPIAPDIPIANGVTVSGVFGNGVAYSATFGNGATVKGKL